MRSLRLGVLLAIVALLLILAGAPAMADPPSTNPNASPATFVCVRGSQTLTFQAVGILQSAQIAGQRVDGHGVIVFTRLVVDGQVVFEVPGQAGRPDLWSCTVVENPSVRLDAFLTPRR
jgi:hypothetical protein